MNGTNFVITFLKYKQKPLYFQDGDRGGAETLGPAQIQYEPQWRGIRYF